MRATNTQIRAFNAVAHEGSFVKAAKRLHLSQPAITLTQQWEEGFSALKKFKEREGNCLVVGWHLEDEYRLGQWVSVQRTAKEKLSEERRHRLDELGFVWKVK